MTHKPKEGPPREGFFERDQYDAVRRHLLLDLQVATAVAYTNGWRMQSEVLMLERRHLDLDTGTLRLDPGTTKNDDGRIVYLTTELKSLLAAQLDGSRRRRSEPSESSRISSAPHGQGAARPAAPRLPKGVGGMQEGCCRWPLSARFQTDRSAQPGECGCARARRDEDHRPQDKVGLRHGHVGRFAS